MLSGFFVAKLVFANSGLKIDISSNEISSGHEMVVVHILHESLNLGSPLDFLLAHSLGYSEWVSLNAGHQSVSEFLVLAKHKGRVSLPSFHRRAVSQ